MLPEEGRRRELAFPHLDGKIGDSGVRNGVRLVHYLLNVRLLHLFLEADTPELILPLRELFDPENGVRVAALHRVFYCLGVFVAQSLCLSLVQGEYPVRGSHHEHILVVDVHKLGLKDFTGRDLRVVGHASDLELEVRSVRLADSLLFERLPLLNDEDVELFLLFEQYVQLGRVRR